MLLCKKVSLCKSSLKIRMGCSHDLLSVLQRGWLVPGTSVGRNINPACFFERPLWSGNESLLAFLERPPWSKKYHDSASLPWPSPEARNDAVRPRNDAVRPRGAGNIRIPLRLRGSRRRRVLTGGPHGEGNALLFGVYGEHPDLHNVADLEHLAGVFDVPVADLGDVYQAVLVHPMSMNAPKSITLRTVPISSMPA